MATKLARTGVLFFVVVHAGFTQNEYWCRDKDRDIVGFFSDFCQLWQEVRLHIIR